MAPLASSAQWDIKRIAKVLLGIKVWSDTLPARNRDAFNKLAHRGWFVDLGTSFGDVQDIVLRVETESEEDVDTFLMNAIRDRVDGIESEVTSLFPERRAILSDAFLAHRSGKYTLSVPVMLTQADGLFSSDKSTNLFEKPKRAQAFKALMQGQPPDGLVAALLSPLDSVLPLWMGPTARGENFTGLSRHQILHGEATNYPTERNSLQVISLLSYIGHIRKGATSPSTSGQSD